jgi:HK97 family phage portal protein
MNLLQKMAGMVFRPADPQIASLFGAGLSESGENINAGSAMRVSSVWACVNLIAGTISTLPVSVTRETADGVPEEVPGHWLNRILQVSPNYDQTPIDYLDFMASSLELEGDAISLKVRGSSGQVIGLDPLIASSVSRRRLVNGKIEYRWTKEGRTYVETDENILHIRGPGGNPLGGMSTLAFARDTFGLARSAERTQNNIMRNGIRPTVALSFANWLTKDQREASKLLPDKFAGIENSGKPIVLEGGTSIEKLSIDPIDAEILLTRGFTVEEICRFFAVPPVMIGHTSKTTSWPSGVEQQFLLFMKLCLRRRVKRIEQAMEKQLLTPMEFARGLRVRFNFEALLRADSLARAQFYEIMRKCGYTINYIRKLEGLPPVPGGDEILVQMQDIPISQAGKQQAPKEPAQITQEDDEDET